MGLIKYSEYLYVAGIVNLAFLFELGNSNNLVELGPKNFSVNGENRLINLYLKKAKVLALLAFVSALLFLTLETFLNLNPNGIQLSADMRFSILIGVVGVGLSFAANVYSKYRIAGKDYKSIMNVIVFSNFIATLFLVSAAYLHTAIWFCILAQFVLQPALVTILLKNRYPNPKRKKIDPLREITDDKIHAPHTIFRFYAVFTPIYGNLIVLLFSRQGDNNLFAAASTIYRITSIPLIFASFAWLNLLWVEIGELKAAGTEINFRMEIAKKFWFSIFLALPFLGLTAMYGTQMISWWTTNKIEISHTLVLQFSVLGLIQIMGVVPGAVMVVYRNTTIILLTHFTYLIVLFLSFRILKFADNPQRILITMILLEFCVILLPNWFWILFRMTRIRPHPIEFFNASDA
ncbi:hypothetical protein MCELANE86_01042 [Candidatus Nanopelagicaceae bacterium]